MAKSKKRSAAGKKAWRTRLRRAKARGQKSVKVGKHRAKVSGAAPKKRRHGKRRAKGGAAITVSRRKKRSGKRRVTIRTQGKRRITVSETRKHRKHRKHRAHETPRKRRRHHHKAHETRRARVRHVHHHHRSRRHRGHMSMENPVTMMEGVAGTLTLLLGLAASDFTDRMLSTHAIVIDTNGNPNDPGQNLTAADGKTAVTGLRNRVLVATPMDLKRWGAGLALTILPFLIASRIKGPVARSAFQLFGFGAGARVFGKGLKDLVVRFTATNATVQRLYADSLVAQLQAGDTAAAVAQAAPTKGLNAALTAGQIASIETGLGHAAGAYAAGNGDQRGGTGDRFGGTGGRVSSAYGPQAGCSCGGRCQKCQAQASQPGSQQTPQSTPSTTYAQNPGQPPPVPQTVQTPPAQAAQPAQPGSFVPAPTPVLPAKMPPGAVGTTGMSGQLAHTRARMGWNNPWTGDARREASAHGPLAGPPEERRNPVLDRLNQQYGQHAFPTQLARGVH